MECFLIPGGSIVVWWVACGLVIPIPVFATWHGVPAVGDVDV